MNCNICKRKLDNPEDPFSIDCGGDCAWCMIPIEYDIGDYTTASLLLEEIRDKIKKQLETK